MVCDGREGRAPDGQKSPIRSRVLPGFYQLPRLGWEGGPAPEGDPVPEGGSAPGLAHGPLAVEGGASPGLGDSAEEEEYSRVSRVRDNVVVLEHQPPLDPSPQPPRDPKQRAAWGALEGGYVDPSQP